MRTLKIFFALFVLMLGLQTQEAVAQRPMFYFQTSSSCNCDSGKQQQAIKQAVLKQLPARLHNRIDFKRLFQTGKVEIFGNPRRTASIGHQQAGNNSYAAPGGGGTEKPECETQKHSGLDSNGNPNTCYTTICHYTAIDKWTVSSQCIKAK